MTVVHLYVDGGVMGSKNPGDGVYWSVAQDLESGHTKILVARHESYEYRTNNEAEYLALIAGLKQASRLDGPVTIHSDSKLILNQFNGVWKIKMAHLKKLWNRARSEARRLDVQVVWAPRKENVRRLGH